ncbi:MAG: hypothetical protein FH761_08255 [Firmicutes bacterium]|nr:hypothetical protein [Bacillota bacterium]
MKYYKQIKEDDIERELTFYENQYEDLVDDGVFCFLENVPARYIQHEMPEYKGNMLIESLPPTYDLSFVFSKLKKLPLYHKDECYKDSLYRQQAIYRLLDCVIPFIKYADIEKKISILIRRGYISRRVMNREFNIIMNENSKIMKKKNKNKYLEMKSISNSASSPFPGFALVGISGGGKSTVLRNILSLYPQCINHTHYQGDNFLFRQLTYIIINCPHKGNLKGICKAFFTKVDEVLGTDYLKKYGKARYNEDDMLSQMAHITQLHALGVLIIDEIQNLASTRNKGEDVLNFFVNLENRMHVPVIYCGTYKAIEQVLSSDFRQARRTSGIGEVYWNRMEKDKYFNYFLDQIWKYQWLHNYTELNEEFVEVMYEVTMGITDRVVKLFMATQLEAILSKKERITPQLIKKVANEHMRLTNPMISALRSGDPQKISKYEDLYCVDYDAIRQNYKQEFENQEQIKAIYESRNREMDSNKQEIKNELIFTMLNIGVTEKKAQKIANKILKEHGYDKELSFLKKKILEKISDSDNSEKVNRGINKKKGNEKSEDEKLSGYEKLKKEGKIKGENE